jgi:hypothetical protein
MRRAHASGKQRSAATGGGVRVVDKVHLLGRLIEAQAGAMRQRYLARPRHLPAPDQPHLGDRVRRGATRPRGDQGGAGAGAAGDAMDARGLEGVGEAHRGQDGGEPPSQHRLASPRGAEEKEEVMGRTPASVLVLRLWRGILEAMAVASYVIAHVSIHLPYLTEDCT